MPPPVDPPDWLRALFTEAGPLALAVITRIVGRQHLSEDVLQETFTVAWRQRDRFDARRGSEVSWLLGIARSRALDALRADGTRLRHEGEAMNEATFGGRREGHDFLAREKLRAALLSLTEGQRACIDLAYFSGFTQSEIALRTGMPLGSVKANVRRGLERLAGFFADEVEDTRPSVGQTPPPTQTEPVTTGQHLTVVHTPRPAEPTLFGRPEELTTTANATQRPRRSG